MTLEERKELVRWVYKMTAAYELLCDRGDRKKEYNILCKEEVRKARDTIAKAIWTGVFDASLIYACEMPDRLTGIDFSRIQAARR